MQNFQESLKKSGHKSFAPPKICLPQHPCPDLNKAERNVCHSSRGWWRFASCRQFSRYVKKSCAVSVASLFYVNCFSHLPYISESHCENSEATETAEAIASLFNDNCFMISWQLLHYFVTIASLFRVKNSAKRQRSKSCRSSKPEWPSVRRRGSSRCWTESARNVRAAANKRSGRWNRNFVTDSSCCSWNQLLLGNARCCHAQFPTVLLFKRRWSLVALPSRCLLVFTMPMTSRCWRHGADFMLARLFHHRNHSAVNVQRISKLPEMLTVASL